MASCCSLCSHLSAILCFEKCCACCVPDDVPYLPSHIDLAFIDGFLHKGSQPVLDSKSKVIGLTTKAFGLGDGMLSQMYRLSLEYEPANAGPKTMVAKVTPENIKMRILGSVLDLFKYEDAFYRLDVGKKLGLNIPKCYFTGLGDYGRYCIILEDFAPAKSADQLKGLPPALIGEALIQVAKLHAKYRGNASTSADTRKWVLRADNTKYYGLIFDTFIKKFEGCSKFYPKLGLSFEQAKPAHDLGQFINDNTDFFATLYTQFFKRNIDSAFPLTLIHGDFRAENILFPQEHMKQFMLFDFQLVKESNGMTDVVYLMFSSMKLDVRRANERRLLETYYNAMHKLGAKDLVWKEVLLMYGFGITMCAVIAFMALKDLFSGPNANDPKTRAFQVQYITSLASLVTDWNAIAMMKKFKSHFNGQSKFKAFLPSDYKEMIPKAYHDLLDGTMEMNEPVETGAVAVAVSVGSSNTVGPTPPTKVEEPAKVDERDL